MNKIDNILVRTAHLPRKINTQCHDYYQIFFVVSGEVELNIAGSAGSIKEGVGCIVPSDIRYDCYGNDKNVVLILEVARNLPVVECETAITPDALSLLLGAPKFFQYDRQMHKLIMTLAEEVRYAGGNNNALGLMGQYLLHSIYYRLGGAQIDDGVRSRERIDLSRIKKFIYNNLSEKIHITDLARLCNISESHFHQKFRSLVGVSPYQYVIDERVNIACAMLRKSEKSVTDICFTLGFSSQSAFANVFRKKIGCSPTCYRNNI